MCTVQQAHLVFFSSRSPSAMRPSSLNASCKWSSLWHAQGYCSSCFKPSDDNWFITAQVQDQVEKSEQGWGVRRHQVSYGLTRLRSSLLPVCKENTTANHHLCRALIYMGSQITNRWKHPLPIRQRQNSVLFAVCCSSLNTNSKAVQISFALWKDAF